MITLTSQHPNLIERPAMFNRRIFTHLAAGAAVLALWGGQTQALAADEAPDALIKRVSSEVLDTIKSDKAIAVDMTKIIALVDSKIMPSVNFQRMTASAVGPAWRQATSEQQKRLQEEFKTLLIRTYSGALSQVSDQTLSFKPLRMAADDKEVIVRSEIRGRSDPIQLDYRLEKSGDNAWRIFNLNVMGIWLVDTYRTQFAQEINAGGVDGLIGALAARNKANAAKKV
jgi:phospholipid transport system substrate-binding protein